MSSVNKEQKALDGMKDYFKGVKSEWYKITWPERQQIFAQTVAVFVIVFIFTLAVYLMDMLFKGLLGLITNR